jgi:hypothetical protein
LLVAVVAEALQLAAAVVRADTFINLAFQFQGP